MLLLNDCITFAVNRDHSISFYLNNKYDVFIGLNEITYNLITSISVVNFSK